MSDNEYEPIGGMLEDVRFTIQLVDNLKQELASLKAENEQLKELVREAIDWQSNDEWLKVAVELTCSKKELVGV